MQESIVKKFREWVAVHPHHPAVEFGGSVLDYQELDEQSERVCSFLRKTCEHQSNIGVEVSDPLAFVISALGVLKSGRTYVPIDAQDSPGRVGDRMAAAKIQVVLDRASLEQCEVGDGPVERTEPGAGPTVPAYIIFTSGSTGAPKAVQCMGAAVINLLESVDGLKAVQPGRRHALWTRFTFDVSIYEMYSALLQGGTLVIAPDEVRADPVEYAQWLLTEKIASAYVPPAGLRPLADHLAQGQVTCLERILVGVEPIKHRLLLDLCDRAPGLTVINGYGPTEATVCCTLYRVEKGKDIHANVPIGQPVRNTRIQLVDANGEEADSGEIIVYGRALSKGYLDLPAGSGSGFGMRDGGEASYATGDLAELDRHGDLVFKGRKDRQIKLRGFRFHPLEVETRLSNIPGISVALVDVAQDSHGNDYLAAYLHGEGGHVLPPATIAAELSNHLQDFKVPTAYHCLPAVFYTVNDKIDRRRTLSQPGIELLQKRDPGGELTRTERRVLAAWQHVLGFEQVHADSEFMLIGGSSLSLLLVKEVLEKALDVKLNVSELFKHRSVRQQAAYLERLASRTDAVDPMLLHDVGDAVRRRKALISQSRDR